MVSLPKLQDVGPDPLGSRADLAATGMTGVASSTALWLLQRYVWHGAPVPAEVSWWVWLVVPYAISQVSGRLVRRRRISALQGPLTAPAAAPATPTPPPPPPDAPVDSHGR